jgi:thiosulfate/3-mercaptopyruvate sulfurtransferase
VPSSWRPAGAALTVTSKLYLGLKIAAAKLSPVLAELAVVTALAAGYARPEQLVDTAWVAAHATDADVRIVDMRGGGGTYSSGHVPGAVELSLLELRGAGPPAFLPTVVAFESLMARLGVSNATRVVVYDERGGVYAARLWWMLQYFGHTNVALLDGGWIKWTAEQRPTSNDTPAVGRASFTARPQPRWLAVASDVVAAIDKPAVRIVDARTPLELKNGFIPSSISVPAEELLDPALLTFRTADDLRRVYDARGILPSHDVIAYCQAGMRASLDLFALYLIGYDKLRNYFGGWEEWDSRRDLPVAK